MKNKLIYIIAAVVVLATIGGGLLLNKNKATKNETLTPTSSTGTTNSSPSAPSKSNPDAGQVTISGAMNKSFKIARTQAMAQGNDWIIYLAESDTSGVTLRFTVGTKPGDYQIEPERNSYKPGVYAKYQIANENAGSTDYLSNKGTLTLTDVVKSNTVADIASGKFSGKFQFTAVDLGTSKTIDVSGSFIDIPIK